MTGPQLWEVGKPVPDWSGPRAEGSQFQIDRNGVHLLHYSRDPTSREVRGARQGKARFALVPASEHTLFLLFNIDLLTKGWSDAPFSLALVAPGLRDREPRSEVQGYLLMSILIDGGKGTVLALRGFSLTPEFSGELDRIVAAQRAALPHWQPDTQNRDVAAAYRRWENSSDMVGAATAITTGGLPFPPEARTSPN